MGERKIKDIFKNIYALIYMGMKLYIKWFDNLASEQIIGKEKKKSQKDDIYFESEEQESIKWNGKSISQQSEHMYKDMLVWKIHGSVTRGV